MSVTRMVPFCVSGFKPLRKPIARGIPRVLSSLASRLPSKNTLTSDKRAMKVIEDAKKRMKSNGVGMGPGSRRGMQNVVQTLCWSSGMSPRRANSYGWLGLNLVIYSVLTYLVLLVLPVEAHPLSYITVS